MTNTGLWTQSGNGFRREHLHKPATAPLLPHVVLFSLWSVGDPAVREGMHQIIKSSDVASFQSAAWRLAKCERGCSVDTGGDFGGTGLIPTSHLRVHSKATYATLEL